MLHHVGIDTTQQGRRCVTFLGNFVVDVDRAKRDCGRVRSRRTPQQATHNKSRKSPCVFACGGFGDGKDRAARNERVLVEQDGEVVAVGVRDDLIRDTRSTIAGFLKDDSMKSRLLE